jgi:hypothetical protein
MKAPKPILTGILSIGFLVAPLAGEAQPVLEQFRYPGCAPGIPSSGGSRIAGSPAAWRP